MPKLTSTLTRVDDNFVAITQSIENDPKQMHIDDLTKEEARILAQRDKELADRAIELTNVRKLLADARKLGVVPSMSVADLVISNAKAPVEVEIKEVATLQPAESGETLDANA